MTVCPATVSGPVRDVVEVFAATEPVTVPLPVPLAGATEIQPTPLAAVHVQVALVGFTLVPKVPPPNASACDVGDTLKLH